MTTDIRSEIAKNSLYYMAQCGCASYLWKRGVREIFEGALAKAHGDDFLKIVDFRFRLFGLWLDNKYMAHNPEIDYKMAKEFFEDKTYWVE